jgi:hypothetical protein
MLNTELMDYYSTLFTNIISNILQNLRNSYVFYKKKQQINLFHESFIYFLTFLLKKKNKKLSQVMH